MGYVLDILIVAVCVVFIVVGAYRGLIRSAAHFLGAVLAACLASALGGLDFVRQLLGALHGDDAKGRHAVFGTEKKLSRLFHMQAFPFFSGICLENTGALGQGFPPPFSS